MNNKKVKNNGMKNFMIKRAFVLFCFLAFCSSVSVFADTIDVRITNRVFAGNATAGTLTFDVEVRPGPGYRSNGAANGEWTAMNLRIDIYGEAGITYNVPTSATATTHDFPSSHNITTNTYGDFGSGLGNVPGVYNTVGIQGGRNDVGATTDLPSVFTRIGTLVIPVVGGVVTDATILKIREETAYLSLHRAFWSNTLAIGVRFPFRQIYPATAAMITVSPQTICSGDAAVLSPTSSAMVSPVTYRLYSSQTSTTVIASGTTTLTTPPVATTTTFYISAENADWDENLPGNRKAVTVTVTPLSIPGMIIVTKQ